MGKYLIKFKVQLPKSKVIWKTRTRGHGHADMENADMENTDMENTGMENADMENTDMENADMENADMENADMENADKHVKNSYMVDGLPCNRFCLPEKFHVSLKYWTK